MTPDITIKDYYLKFIYNAKIDKYKYEQKLNTIEQLKNNLIEYLIKYENTIKNKYNITIDTIKNNYESIQKIINDLIKKDETNVILLQINKYGDYLKNQIELYKLINLANKRKDLKFRQFQTIVCNYYYKVHKCILEGMGYKYGYGIGTYCCNYWKLSESAAKKKVLDFAATKAKKKELIEKGIKTYDDNEAAWYKARGIPYDGIDYRVYVNKTHYYEFTLINSRISKSVPYNYERNEYVSSKYKNMSQQKIADTFCNNIEDIYTLQMDIKYKLNILLIKNPNKYLNFVRNVDQYKYKHRAYNSENR